MTVTRFAHGTGMFKLASLTLTPCSQKRSSCLTIAWVRAGLPTRPQTSCCEVARPCAKVLVVLFSLPCTFLAREFHCGKWRNRRVRGTAESCIVSEVVAQSYFAMWPRSYIDERISSRIRSEGGRIGAVLFKSNGHQPKNWFFRYPRGVPCLESLTT